MIRIIDERPALLSLNCPVSIQRSSGFNGSNPAIPAKDRRWPATVPATLDRRLTARRRAPPRARSAQECAKFRPVCRQLGSVIGTSPARRARRIRRGGRPTRRPVSDRRAFCTAQPMPISMAPSSRRTPAGRGRNGPCPGQGGCPCGSTATSGTSTRSGSTSGRVERRLEACPWAGFVGSAREEAKGASVIGEGRDKRRRAARSRAISIAGSGLISLGSGAIAANDRAISPAADLETSASAAFKHVRVLRGSSVATNACAPLARDAAERNLVGRKLESVTGPPWPFAGNPLTPQTSGGSHVHRTRVRTGTAPLGYLIASGIFDGPYRAVPVAPI